MVLRGSWEHGSRAAAIGTVEYAHLTKMAFPVCLSDTAAGTLRGAVLNKFDLYSSQICDMSSSERSHANRTPVALQALSGLCSHREDQAGLIAGCALHRPRAYMALMKVRARGSLSPRLGSY